MFYTYSYTKYTGGSTTFINNISPWTLKRQRLPCEIVIIKKEINKLMNERKKERNTKIFVLN
jgi:hypothetical protein